MTKTEIIEHLLAEALAEDAREGDGQGFNRDSFFAFCPEEDPDAVEDAWRAYGAHWRALKAKFRLIRSDHGDGGWSLHARGRYDVIEPPILTGTAEWDHGRDDWDRPNVRDWIIADGRVAS